MKRLLGLVAASFFLASSLAAAAYKDGILISAKEAKKTTRETRCSIC